MRTKQEYLKSLEAAKNAIAAYDKLAIFYEQQVADLKQELAIERQKNQDLIRLGTRVLEVAEEVSDAQS